MELTEMVFDSPDPVVMPVRIGKLSGFLHEASAGDVVKYRDEVARAGKFGDDGRVDWNTSLAKAELTLVCCCLRLTADGGSPPLATMEQLSGWSNRVQKALFAKVGEISALDDKPTIESLEARIAALQKQLAELRKGDTVGKG